MIILKIFYGLFLIAAGAFMLRYRKDIKSRTGNFYWAEKYLGRGGTYIIIIIIGIGLIFVGTIYPFGGIEIFTGRETLQQSSTI